MWLVRRDGINKEEKLKTLERMRCDVDRSNYGGDSRGGLPNVGRGMGITKRTA